MAHSDLFFGNKLNVLHSAFTNNYLLKHGNIFMKPEFGVSGFPYSFLSTDIGFNASSGCNGLSGSVPNNEAPLDFAIKHEKPPTPPASTSPVSSKTPPLTEEKPTGDQSKNGTTTWILGKQKLSWDNSIVASYNPETKMFRCVVCNAVGFLSRIAEHYLGTHTSAKVFQCLHCPYSSTWSRCVRMHMAKHHGVPNAPPSLWKGQPLLEEIFQLLTNLKTTVDSQGRDRADPEVCDKKFICPKCPYTTDRRDLYLRHENIHKEDKPYHCYICFKLFNRADHVKKHFLRIHRGHPYDISLVRRRPPKVSSSTTFAQKSLSNGSVTVKVSDNGKAVNPSPATLRNGILDTALKDSNSTALTNSLEGFKQAKGFECPFCPWEGADAWCLRRHMNIHIKSFGCPICDFKSSKAERLFTHVYKLHRMLVCTKCKYVTDQAQLFENHIKACCAELAVSTHQLKPQHEDSANDSDTSNSSGIKQQRDHSSKSDDSNAQLLVQPSDKSSTHNEEFKASISIIPLHNSLSYCFPAQPSPSQSVKAFEASRKDFKSKHVEMKLEIKSELPSPIQSSSDSGLTDIGNDQSSLDLTCWDCGCELADESSLNTHTELYHRTISDKSDKNSEVARQKKKFSCALCNFSSKEQKTILDHMRFHTGESLVCRAEPSCAFTTIFDSTLREHVLKEHADGKQRCPHCGMYCTDRVTFIRHYRKCHHSTSCYRCRDLKHSFDRSSSVIQPYLRHNPYSKIHNNDRNIPHINGTATPNTGSKASSYEFALSDHLDHHHKERRSRKQSTPRKLVHPLPGATKRSQSKIPPRPVRSASKTSTFYRRFLGKQRSSANRFWYCKKCYRNPRCYKSQLNFIMHNLWSHNANKYKCKSCEQRFSHKYRILLHKRKHHELC